MTTQPTPRTDAICAAINAALRPYTEHFTTATAMLMLNQFEEIEKLERENQQLQEVNRVANDLLGAQANENDKIHKHLLERAEKAEQSCRDWALGVESSNTDIVDMLRDEFQRIVAFTDNTEIKGICERAIATIEQTVPVIVQRDTLKQKLEQAEAKMAEKDWALRASLIGSCTCMTKTPDPKYHDPNCRVVMIENALASESPSPFVHKDEVRKIAASLDECDPGQYTFDEWETVDGRIVRSRKWQCKSCGASAPRRLDIVHVDTCKCRRRQEALALARDLKVIGQFVT